MPVILFQNEGISALSFTLELSLSTRCGRNYAKIGEMQSTFINHLVGTYAHESLSNIFATTIEKKKEVTGMF